MSGNVLGKIIGRTLGLLCLTAALAACNDGSSGSSTADAASAQTVTVAANTAYSFHPQVASSAASYSIVHKPAWANFNTSTGELSGTPSSADAGQYSNIIISADANGSSVPLPPLSIIVTPATPAGTPTADPVASTGPNPTGPSTTTSNESGSSSGAGGSSSSSGGNTVASGSSSGTASGSSGTASGSTASNGGSSSSGSSGSGSSSGSSTTASSSITLAWDAPTENTNGSALTNLAGFQILYGTSSSSLTQTISINSVGILSYVVENLTPGTWYFEVVAVNSAGEVSGPSTVVSVTI